jgi:hypothetical protein
MTRSTKLACVALAVAFAVTGCAGPKKAVRRTFAGQKAWRLLTSVPQAETTARGEKRTDLYVHIESGEPVPAVVGTGQAGPISIQGGQARLFGDEKGTQGWSVDNFVLLELVNAKGDVVHRMALGFQQGVTRGSEEIDSVGPMQFNFGPGEIDLTRFLPPEEPFTLRATALDTGGVGRVSDLYLVVSGETSARTGDEEWRDQ